MIINARIVVDADSCPVKDEIIQVGREFQVPVILVASFAHYSSEQEGAKIYYVDQSSQSVDLFIANFIEQGDIVVTGDYGLASIVLKPNIKAVSFRGIEYTQDNIDIFLAQRHHTLKTKQSGGRLKGPKPFTSVDSEKFVEILRKILNLKQEI